MYLFTRQFWNDLLSDPREALDTLKAHGSRIWHPVVRTAVFWRIVFSEYALNHCITRASALAFALLLTLIPLVVTTAFMLAYLVEVRPHEVEQFFSVLLPFAPPTVLDYLSTFFVNAQRLRGWGIGGLVVVAVGLFGAAEEAFNTIWKAAKPRSFLMRLRAFTMVLVYSPLLFYLSHNFRRSAWLTHLSGYFSLIDFILPFFLMVLAFTSLIWLVPNTRVRFSSAFLGGLVAGVLFEFERRGFGLYVQLSIQTQTIYGTFGILPLFLVSLFFVSLIVLFGAEVAYVHQNFRPLLRAVRRWDRRVGDFKTYLSLRMFIDAAAAFMLQKEPPSLFHYMNKYELTEQQALGLLGGLIHANYLHNTGDKEHFVPTRDFSATPVLDVLDDLQAQGLHVPPTPADYTREFIASLINNSQKRTVSPEAHITCGEMILNLAQGERQFSKAVPAA
jgi:membrane protein